MDHEHCSSLPRSRSHRAHNRAPGRERCRRLWALDVRRKHVVTEYPNLLSDSHPSKESPRIPLNSPSGGASRGAFSRAFVGPAWFASRGGTPEIAASVRQLEHAAVTAVQLRTHWTRGLSASRDGTSETVFCKPFL